MIPCRLPRKLRRKKLRISQTTSTSTQTATTTSINANTSPTEDPTVKGTITLRIAGITEYMDKIGQETKSDVVQCGGLGWYIVAKPENEDGKRYLACFLYGPSEGTWSAWVSHTMSVVNKDATGIDHIARGNEILHGSGLLTTGWGHRQFISKGALLTQKNGFVTDDAVAIRVDFTIKNVYGAAFDIFGDEDALPSDVEFIVEDAAFYANKGYLSVISPMFRTMFASNFVENGRQEIPLRNVKADDFRQFLMAVYPMQQQLTDTNVLPIFRLADYFRVDRLFASCEGYLKGKNGVPVIDKLIVADALGRTDLRESIISKLTKSDVKSIAEDENSTKLKKELLLDILKKHVKICN